MSAPAVLAKAHKRDKHHVEAWSGGHRPYDLVKEVVVAVLVVTLVALVLAIMFGSPDDQPVTLQRWAQADAKDFVATSVSELDGSSEVATYGPPYQSSTENVQKIGPLCLQCIPGATISINTAQDFVLGPLHAEAGDDPALNSSLSRYTSASASQQKAWTDAYTKGLDRATISGETIQMSVGDYGPVQPMMQDLLALAQSGGLDGALLSTKQFYQTDYTKPILYIAGGSYFESQAEARHLLGGQWGMMNETGNWPGQPWLWLYTFWYQVPPFSSSGNADALIWGIMILLSVIMILVPFIPGLRGIPHAVPVYRFIWRDYYRRVEGRA